MPARPSNIPPSSLAGAARFAASASSSWGSVAGLPATRWQLVAAASGTDVYAIGGVDGGVGASVLRYSPATDSWTSVAPTLVGREDAAAVATPDGRIYVLGGYAVAFGQYTASVEVYTPSTDTWSFVAPMPDSREYLTALMRDFEGNVTRAAEHAGIERESLHRLLKRYSIRSDDFKPR